jgi:NitT/TauT family transport system substrate-binding protein
VAHPFRRSLLVIPLLVALAACSNGPGGSPSGDAAASGGAGAQTALRLGYFPNVTHAAALVGIEDGVFSSALDGIATLTTTPFNAGPAAVESILTEAIDATFIGPNPAINAFAQSDGTAIRIVSGATSGGAFLVVRDGIDSAADLAGTKLATPQLGNTQDVALRTWLGEQGYATTLEGGGDVSILPQENAQTLATLQSGDIDGAWVPEPWATRLIEEGGGHILVDERDLWPDGRYVTTHLIVRTGYLEEHPDAVEALLGALVEVTDRLGTDPAGSQVLVNQGIEAVTGSPLAKAVLSSAWSNLEFTVDPVASSLATSAQHATELGLLDPVDLDGIYDLRLLNEVLAEGGKEPVSDQ